MRTPAGRAYTFVKVSGPIVAVGALAGLRENRHDPVEVAPTVA